MSPGLTVIDAAQLSRIESTHRGFLYQHLFAVGCMLLAQRNGVSVIHVEKDEDIEIVKGSDHLYVQVKTRAVQINQSDISSALERFVDVRAIHSSGERPGNPTLCIVSNVAPGPLLSKAYTDPGWPMDVKLKWPDCSDGTLPCLPPAWATVSDGIDWCIHEADGIPFGGVAGKVLVWKLAAIVQFASAGEAPFHHELSVATFEDLFNQVIIQLQAFPETPKPYVSHEDEPPYFSEKAVRIVSGHSGAGKTSWAAEASNHIDVPAIYFNASESPVSAIASSITREVTAQLFPHSSEERQSVLLPGISGLDSLRALDLLLEKRQTSIVCFLDNAHQLDPYAVVEIVSSTKRVRWILLCQHHPNEGILATTLQIDAEALIGWNARDIASQCRINECPIDIKTAEQLRSITSGLPLLIQSTILVAKTSYQGDVRRFCADMIEAIHVSESPQEAILKKVFGQLSEQSRMAIGVISLLNVPVTADEARSVVASALQITERNASRLLRELVSWSVVYMLRSGRLVLHDAMRILATEESDALGDEIVLRARRQIKKIFVKSLREFPDLPRQVALLRLLPLIGDIEELIEIATNEAEHLKELGLSEEIGGILYEVVVDKSRSEKDKFWVFDTLALWSYDRGDLTQSERHVDEMEVLYQSGLLSGRERCALGTKRLLILGRKGMVDEALAELTEVTSLVDNAEHLRIIKYDFGVGLFHAKQFPVASDVARRLVEEYYEVLGLKLEDVLAKNPEEIVRSLGGDESKINNLKRLADSLDLLAQTNERMGIPAAIQRIHAFKFYVMCAAFRSAVRVGQDVVHEFVANVESPEDARQFIEEHLLPLISRFQLFDHVLPIRSQYAVVLAYCGDFMAAREEVKHLKAFEPSDSSERSRLNEQFCLVERIIGGENPFQRRKERSVIHHNKVKPPVANSVSPVVHNRPGRNKPCYCGSGKKYKHCCWKKDR